MAVRDQACPEAICCELLPDVVVVPRDHGVRAVSQVSGQPGTRANGREDIRAPCACVPDGRNDPGLRQTLDQINGRGDLRRKGKQADPSTGGILKGLHLIPVGEPHMLSWMGTARTVLGRDVRPFDVDPDDGPIYPRRLLAGPRNGAQGCDHVRAALRADSRTEPCHAVAPQCPNYCGHVVWAGAWCVEIMASEAVDLDVNKPRDDPQIVRPKLIRTYREDTLNGAAGDRDPD